MNRMLGITYKSACAISGRFNCWEFPTKYYLPLHLPEQAIQRQKLIQWCKGMKKELHRLGE